MYQPCFICGSCPNSNKSPENLKWLLSTLCQLLNICSYVDWSFVGASEMNPKCCSECHNQLTLIKQTHQRLLSTQKKLNDYLVHLKKSVQDSAERVDDTRLRPEVTKFRHEFANRKILKNNPLLVSTFLTTSQDFKQEGTTTQQSEKIETENGSDVNFENCVPVHKPLPWLRNGCNDNTSDPLENNRGAIQTGHLGDNKNDCDNDHASFDDNWEVDFAQESDPIHTQLQSRTKPRKIIVIAEEDEHREENPSIPQLESVPIRTSSRTASNNLKKKYSTIKKKKTSLSKSLSNCLPRDADGFYRCAEQGCSYYTKNGQNFMRHVKSHIPLELRPDLVDCPECGVKIFEESLPRHILQVHRPDAHEKGLTCPDCGKKFLSCHGYHFRVHLSRHRNDTPFICEECGKQFVTRGLLKNHVLDAHEILHLKCEQCGEEFSKMYSFRRHWKRKHPNKKFRSSSPGKDELPPDKTKPAPALLTCTEPDCKYSTVDKHRFKRHTHSHLPKDQRPDYVLCPECGVSINQEYLRKHMIKCHHPEGEPPGEPLKKVKHGPLLACSHEGCSYSTQDKPRLIRHERTHLPIDSRPDVALCPECGIRIFKESSKKHILLCHNPGLDGLPNVLECPYCEKKFLPRDKARYEVHLKGHRGEKAFECEQCGKGFVTRHQVKLHMKSVHEDVDITCEQCGKKFRKVLGFRAHWMKHHPNEPYPLLKGRAPRIRGNFYNQFEVEKKVREMVPERKWPCEECDQVCSSRSNLDRHKRRVHGGTDCGGGSGTRKVNN